MRPASLPLLIALLAAPTAAHAQSLPDSLTRRIDSVFAAYDHTDTPGCALGVYQGGRIAYARGYGMANLELGSALSSKSFLDIGSTSKQFTAFAIALLEQDGKLSRTDPVRKYIPELAPYADGITVEQLMQHTSGIRDYLVLMYLAGWRTEDWTDAKDAMRLVARQREANFAPDAEWLYSNSGYFLLSQIVERVSGTTMRAFTTERMFAPLGMRASHVHDDHGMIVPFRAQAYEPRPEGGFTIDMSNFEQTGDGAVQTSIEELQRWDENFYTGQVGGMALVRKQLEPGTLASGKAIDYAGGLLISTYRGLPVVKHSGAWAGYRAELLRFPEQHTSFAVLCNRGDADPSQKANRVADILLAGVLQAPAAEAATVTPAKNAVAVPVDALRKYVGVWRGRKTGEERIMELADSQLVLKIGDAIPLTPLSAERFSLLGAYSIRFEVENGKQVMIPEQTAIGDERFDQLPPFHPAPAQLTEYVGNYASPELDVTWQVASDSLGLKAEHKGRKLLRLLPTSADVFTSDEGASLRFMRGKSKKLSGFTVGFGRVRNIGFERVR